MGQEPADKSGISGDAFYDAAARDLAAYAAEQRRLFGDTDENLIAAYLSGVATPEEKAKVEKAIEEFPAVREWVDSARQGISGDSGSPGRTDRSWTDHARRPEAEPETPDVKPPTGRSPGR